MQNLITIYRICIDIGSMMTTTFFSKGNVTQIHSDLGFNTYVDFIYKCGTFQDDKTVYLTTSQDVLLQQGTS